MSISPTSLLVSVLSSGLLVIFLSILILRKNIVAYLNPRYLQLCVVLIMIRCFLPCEFFYTITFKSRNILPFIQRFGKLPLPGIGITAEQTLVSAWIAAALLKLAVLVLKQYRTEQAVNRFPVSRKMPLLAELLCAENISDNIQLIEIPQLSTPALVGLVNPKIIIPCDVPDQDLHYILLHELEHHKHRDLYFIVMLHLLCIVYWWNPFMYLLRYSARKVLEYRADAAVVRHLKAEEKTAYLKSIIDILSLKNQKNVKASLGISLYEKESDLYQRFYLVLENRPQKSGRHLFDLILAAALLSTVFIFEPYSIPEKVAASTFSLHGNCFLSEHDGVYDLYINDEYYLTVNRTDGFEDLPIVKKD